MEKVYLIRKNLCAIEYYYDFKYWQSRKNKLICDGGEIIRIENTLTVICKDNNCYVFDVQIV